MPTTAAAGDRRRKRSRQKSLDSIDDSAAFSTPVKGADNEPRRSTRVRRAPVLLDTSPAPSPRRKRLKQASPGVLGERRSSRVRQRSTRLEFGEEKGSLQFRSERLRAKAMGRATTGDAVGVARRRGIDLNEIACEEEELEEEENEVVGVPSGCDDDDDNDDDVNDEGDSVSEERIELSIEDDEEDADMQLSVQSGDENDDNDVLPSNDLINSDHEVSKGKDDDMDLGGGGEVEKESEGHDGDVHVKDNGCVNSSDKQDNGVGILEREDALLDISVRSQSAEDPKAQSEEIIEFVDEETQRTDQKTCPKSTISEEKAVRENSKEGRRCGLCGGGIDGRPPKVVVSDSGESGNDAYEGPSAFEESNYDKWDGFGDDPGWLGRLLGPIRDRFGIARVWVHQNCAVWSPEVYFAGVGCLKNVRAALCRGRALKCSRCGRPGATIGCRVDRCPKTFHLPCSRAEASVFDHRKFLIACHDHRHLFQPHGEKFEELMRKLKAKKMRKDMRKLSHDALRKDIEAEDKWLENCGEDEEFLKREGKRLHRDLQRIAPTFIGGSLKNDNVFHGWESVAGLQDVIKSLKEVVILPLLYPELFSSLNLTPPRGVLLHGYPGTGKTLVVRALIGACSRGDKKIAYFARKGADCLGKYVGDAERQLRLLFQVAERAQPSIIFFDEIDGLAPCRSRQQDQTHNSVVSTLLSLLDGLKSRGSVIVIGATNRPDAVDPALRRPGRFDREIYFPLPNLESRTAILSLHSKNWPHPLEGTILSFLAKQTVGYAGADLQAICTLAAMNALKRSCPLHDLLRSAEKDFIKNRLPTLPSIVVEERDWLAALASAPLPCSQREAGTAANDVFFYPMHTHLIPCLLKPLVHILIALCMDGRLCLPSSLLKAATSVKGVVFSTLEKMEVPMASWSCRFDSLFQQQDVFKRLEEILLRYGLANNLLGLDELAGVENHRSDNEKFDASQSDFARTIGCQAIRKMSSFCILVAGPPRSGQQFLAGTVLQCFMGQTEIQKINLATMSMEGNGDVISGLAHIFTKCRGLRQCVIYLPRLDHWAIKNAENFDCENMSVTKLPSSHKSCSLAQGCSEVWNSFVEQINSTSASVACTIVATSEMQFSDLPIGVQQFFDPSVLDQRNVSRHTIPRFSVNIEGNFSRETVTQSGAFALSQVLVQHFVQLIHLRIHENISVKQKERLKSSACASNLETTAVKKSKVLTKISETQTLGNEASLIGEEKAQFITDNWQSFSSVNVSLDNIRKTETWSSKKSEKNVKDILRQAIIMFGYQILRHRQFAKLCWVTSKLKEGPSANINGPWRGWPFNSCMLHGRTCEKNSPGADNGDKVNEEPNIVRGLVAVGLLAYKGIYTSATEVCVDVRKVLELLVSEIRTKAAEKKNPYRYFHILAQAAYLEDVVNNWGYTYQRTNADKASPLHVEKEQSLVRDNCAVIELDGRCDETHDFAATEVQEKLQNHGSHSSFDNGPHIDASTTQCSQPCPFSPKSLPDQFCAANEDVVDGSGELETACHLEVDKVVLKKCDSNTESSKQPNDYQRRENCAHSIAEGSNCNDSMSHEEADHDVYKDAVHDNNEVRKATCSYKCCYECFSAIYELVYQNLFSAVNSSIDCSTIEDMHDIVISTKLKLLSTVRKHYSSNAAFDQKDSFEHLQPVNTVWEVCCCQSAEDLQGRKKSTEYLPSACSFHSVDSKLAGVSHKFSDGSVLSFYFRDGILLPSPANLDGDFHCSIKRLCLSPIVRLLSKAKDSA